MDRINFVHDKVRYQAVGYIKINVRFHKSSKFVNQMTTISFSMRTVFQGDTWRQYQKNFRIRSPTNLVVWSILWKARTAPRARHKELPETYSAGTTNTMTRHNHKNLKQLKLPDFHCDDVFLRHSVAPHFLKKPIKAQGRNTGCSKNLK